MPPLGRRTLLAAGAASVALPALAHTKDAPVTRYMTPQDLLDRAEIIDLVNRAAFAADHRDWATARACFADRVDLDYTSLAGGQPGDVHADDMITSWRGSLPGFDATQHIITNHLVTLSAARAECLSHFRAQHRIGAGAEARIWELDGDYRHRFARTPDDWRIDGLTMTWTFERGDRGLLGLAVERAKRS